MELDLVRSSDRFFPDGVGAHVEEVVRDDVEAMELGWVKIEYVDDFEGPALRPHGCWFFSFLFISILNVCCMVKMLAVDWVVYSARRLRLRRSSATTVFSIPPFKRRSS